MDSDIRGLRTLREKSGFSQHQVERITKGRITTAYLSRLEHGSIKYPSLATASEIAAVYGITIDELAALICPIPIVKQNNPDG